jgi:hypothetical protein
MAVFRLRQGYGGQAVPLSRSAVLGPACVSSGVRWQHHMRTNAKQFAVIALLWAILSPPFLHVLASAHGRDLPWRLHILARDLRSELPKEPASQTVLVSFPVQRISNSALLLDGIAEDLEQRSEIAGETIVSSVVIIILAICILRTGKRNANTAT